MENKVSYLAFHNAWNNGIHAFHGIVHFTVACLVTKPFNRSEAKGDLVMIQTWLLSKVNCLVVMLDTGLYYNKVTFSLTPNQRLGN